MGRFRFRRLALIGLIFLILGIVGMAYSLNKLANEQIGQTIRIGGLIGLMSTQLGMISLMFFVIGFLIICVGIGKKLRVWVGLE